MAQLRVDITSGVVQPIPIAVSPFAGDSARRPGLGRRDRERDHQRSAELRPVRRDRPARLHPDARASCAARRALPTGARSTPRRWSAAWSRPAAGGAARRSSSAFGTCSPASRCAGFGSMRRRQWRADRAQDRRRDLRAADRRARLFRHPRHLHRGDRRRARRGQARGPDGPGRLRQPLPDRRQLPRADAALLARRPADRLHGLSGRGRRASIVIDVDSGRERAARRLPGHDLRAALRAGRRAACCSPWPRTATPTSICGTSPAGAPRG